MAKFNKILIVDDAELDRVTLKKILEKHGYTVIVAEDGHDGIQKAKSEHPDCIIMDVVMPALSGFEATRMLKDAAETKDIPVVICSTKGLSTDQKWGIRQGAKEYIVKPIKEDNVLEKIKAVENLSS